MARSVQASQLVGAFSYDSSVGQVSSSQLMALLAIGPPNASFAHMAQLMTLVAVESDVAAASVQTSEVVALVAYFEGDPNPRYDSRAWGFTLDQHEFYVLHLGDQGTYVFDVLTGEWSEWETDGYVGWNAENGVTWNGEVYFADRAQPIIWRMNPDSFLDEDFRIINRVVTGAVPVRTRDFYSCFAAFLTAKVGAPDPENGSTVRLRFSDDAGETWFDAGSVELSLGDYTQELSWRSLGQMGAPGRIFEVADWGGTVRIDGFDIETDMEGDDGA